MTVTFLAPPLETSAECLLCYGDGDESAGMPFHSMSAAVDLAMSSPPIHSFSIWAQHGREWKPVLTVEDAA